MGALWEPGFDPAGRLRRGSQGSSSGRRTNGGDPTRRTALSGIGDAQPTRIAGFQTAGRARRTAVFAPIFRTARASQLAGGGLSKRRSESVWRSSTRSSRLGARLDFLGNQSSPSIQGAEDHRACARRPLVAWLFRLRLVDQRGEDAKCKGFFADGLPSCAQPSA